MNIASSVTVRLRGSYAVDRGLIPGWFGVFLSRSRACIFVYHVKRVRSGMIGYSYIGHRNVDDILPAA